MFSASVEFTPDLHSMGQFIQEGKRNLLEIVLQVNNLKIELVIKDDLENIDGLNFLAGKTMDEVNKKAFEATVLAHIDGGVPNLLVEMNEFSFGELVYFFQKAAGLVHIY